MATNGAKKNSVTSTDSEADIIADLTTVSNRLSSRLAENEVFKTKKVGVAEWSAMRKIARREKIGMPQFGTILAVSRQRVKQITDALTEQGYAEISPIPKNEKARVIRLSAKGKDALAALDGAVTTVVRDVFADNLKPVLSARNAVRRLVASITPKPDSAATPSAVDA